MVSTQNLATLSLIAGQRRTTIPSVVARFGRKIQTFVGERARGEVDRKIRKVERATGSDKLEHPIDSMLREAVACDCTFGTSMKEKLRKKWNSLETKLVSSLM